MTKKRNAECLGGGSPKDYRFALDDARHVHCCRLEAFASSLSRGWLAARARIEGILESCNHMGGVAKHVDPADVCRRFKLIWQLTT